MNLKKPSAMVAPIPTFRFRADLGDILTREGKKIGVELGVQQGLFASTILKRWKTVTEYNLVDIWAFQPNYVDLANVDQNAQNRIYNDAMRNTAPWKDQIKVCRDLTTEC